MLRSNEEVMFNRSTKLYIPNQKTLKQLKLNFYYTGE